MTNTEHTGTKTEEGVMAVQRETAREMKRYYLDLFSGIGGFALGAEWAGLEFDGHYFSEVDEYASSVYKKRFPDAIALGNIKRIDYSKLREEIMGGLSKVKAERYEDW